MQGPLKLTLALALALSACLPAKMRLTPDAFHTWSSRPWIALSDRVTRTCEVTFFATTTRRPPNLMVLGGEVQPPEPGAWSWSARRVLREAERRTIAFEFRNPETGALLACHEETVVCYSPYAVSLDAKEVREGQCHPEAVAPVGKVQKPHLVGHVHPPLAMSDAAIGGAYVDVDFEIVGQLTEEWWCPRLEVRWPDDTVTMRESDCTPFEQRDPKERFRWKFNHGFPSGEWRVRGCLYKSGATLACEDVRVRVVGGDAATAPFMGDGR